MSNGQNRQQVTALFEKLCQAVEAAGWQIDEKNAKEKFPFVQYTTVRGDGAYPTIAAIHPEMMILMVVMDLQVQFLGAHPRELAVAMQLVNRNLLLGGFDTFVERERICYRLCCACRDAEPTVEHLTQLLINGATIAAGYEPLFMQVWNESLTMRQFAAELESKRVICIPGGEESKAPQAFAAVCKWLEQSGIACRLCEENLGGRLRMPKEQGERIFDFWVDAVTGSIQLRQKLPLQVSPLRRIDMAMAINYINSQTDAGYFTYDVSTAELEYRMTALYSDGDCAVRNFQFMLEQAETNEKVYLRPLSLLNDGDLTLWQFRNQV